MVRRISADQWSHPSCNQSGLIILLSFLHQDVLVEWAVAGPRQSPSDAENFVLERNRLKQIPVGRSSSLHREKQTYCERGKGLNL